MTRKKFRFSLKFVSNQNESKEIKILGLQELIKKRTGTQTDDKNDQTNEKKRNGNGLHELRLIRSTVENQDAEKRYDDDKQARHRDARMNKGTISVKLTITALTVWLRKINKTKLRSVEIRGLDRKCFV